MGWVTVDEAAWKAHRDKIREEFTWEDAARRMALETEWPFYETRWLKELEEVGLHPFDAYEALRAFFWLPSMQGKVRALIKILNLSKEGN